LGCAHKYVAAPHTSSPHTAPPPHAAPIPKKPAPPPTEAKARPKKTTKPPAPAKEAVNLSSKDFGKTYFDFDTFVLSDSAMRELDHDAKLLRSHPKVTISVEGHCDERGTVEYDIALGEKRALAVRDYLVNSGIDRSRIETVSYGKERPVDEGHNEQAWARNRRVEILVSRGERAK
ncbi:MAG: peptidoglycan-associated lipoprotein Pal, partial [Candidatus Eisenbacteria bacterium]|nr:peptidoglycan-associated lipoprotein Pal [Candidatus Eisenbacteria bacterium]